MLSETQLLPVAYGVLSIILVLGIWHALGMCQRSMMLYAHAVVAVLLVLVVPDVIWLIVTTDPTTLLGRRVKGLHVLIDKASRSTESSRAIGLEDALADDINAHVLDIKNMWLQTLAYYASVVSACVATYAFVLLGGSARRKPQRGGGFGLLNYLKTKFKRDKAAGDVNASAVQSDANVAQQQGVVTQQQGDIVTQQQGDIVTQQQGDIVPEQQGAIVPEQQGAIVPEQHGDVVTQQGVVTLNGDVPEHGDPPKNGDVPENGDVVAQQNANGSSNGSDANEPSAEATSETKEEDADPKDLATSSFVIFHAGLGCGPSVSWLSTVTGLDSNHAVYMCNPSQAGTVGHIALAKAWGSRMLKNGWVLKVKDRVEGMLKSDKAARVLLVGHSYGGAVVSAVGYLLGPTYGDRIQVATFGSIYIPPSANGAKMVHYQFLGDVAKRVHGMREPTEASTQPDRNNIIWLKPPQMGGGIFGSKVEWEIHNSYQPLITRVLRARSYLAGTMTSFDKEVPSSNQASLNRFKFMMGQHTTSVMSGKSSSKAVTNGLDGPDDTAPGSSSAPEPSATPEMSATPEPSGTRPEPSATPESSSTGSSGTGSSGNLEPSGTAGSSSTLESSGTGSGKSGIPTGVQGQSQDKEVEVDDAKEGTAHTTNMQTGILVFASMCIFGLLMVLCPILVMQEDFVASKLDGAVAAARQVLDTHMIAQRASSAAICIGLLSFILS
jgi:Lipase (class 3)